ncbi:MAG: class I SAM-dependent methyltransferase [Myxococcota bacterium]|jgi:SAM-dependent methyltransferase|nr:class I SAM-dependent methyltransferase [Myxococcota bacterium]
MSRPDEHSAAQEFDRWADRGRAESMARGHRPATEQATETWSLGAGDVVLDVGCGNGWALRWMLERGAGRGIGVDISPRMIERAQKAAHGDPRLQFRCGSAEELPVEDSHVTHVLNIESLYYYPDPASALLEWARVTGPGGRLAMVLDLYRENPASHCWIDALEVDVHLLSTSQCVELANAAGWGEVRHRRARDLRPPTPRELFEPSRFWPDYDMYLACHEAGSLVVEAVRVGSEHR